MPERQIVFTRLRGTLDVRSARRDDLSELPQLTTRLGAVDEALGGGLPLGAVTELLCPIASCGGQLLLAHLLTCTRALLQRVALVDACDAFDPPSFPPDLYRHVVWVRCAGVPTALQVADLIVRDANFGLVVLDLKHADARELRRTPSTIWYRLQRAVEPASLALLVITSQAVVPSAQLRIELTQPFTAVDLPCERTVLTERLAPVVQRQRLRAMREAAG